MTSPLLRYRRTLCKAMDGLAGDEWLAVVGLINRIDARIAPPRRTISLSGDVSEIPAMITVLEGIHRRAQA